MKSWIAQIALMVAGIVGTVGVNYLVNSPSTQPPQVTRLVESLADSKDWARVLDRVGINSTLSVGLANKEATIKVVPGTFWADVYTRKSMKYKNQMDYEFYRSDNPWIRCTSLTYSDAAAINRAARAALNAVELSELEK